MKLHLWGTDFRRTSPELRARLFCAPEGRERLLKELLSLGFSDLVYLYTCNRVEFFTTAKDHFCDTRRLWLQTLSRFGLGEEVYFQGYHYEGKAAVRHLMRVAASLESLVIGEPQILGQLKDAVRFTKESGLPLFSSTERVFQLAFETAKQVRTKTALGEKSLSVASLGLQHLQAMEGEHPLKKAVVVGRSPISVIVVQWMLKHRPGTPILWVNRDPSRLKPYAESGRTELMSLSDFLGAPPDFSHLFTATASEAPVFTQSFFDRLSSHPVVFDFAQPPDVERTAKAVLVHLEDLGQEARRNADSRAKAVSEAELIIESALKGYCQVTKEAPLLKDFSEIEPRFNEELESALLALNGELPVDIQPKLRRWAEKLVKRNLHHSREHLRRLLRQTANGEGNHGHGDL